MAAALCAPFSCQGKKAALRFNDINSEQRVNFHRILPGA